MAWWSKSQFKFVITLQVAETLQKDWYGPSSFPSIATIFLDDLLQDINHTMC